MEFFLHNSIRPEITRTVSEVVEEFLVAKRANGLRTARLPRSGGPWRNGDNFPGYIADMTTWIGLQVVNRHSAVRIKNLGTNVGKA